MEGGTAAVETQHSAQGTCLGAEMEGRHCHLRASVADNLILGLPVPREQGKRSWKETVRLEIIESEQTLVMEILVHAQGREAAPRGASRHGVGSVVSAPSHSFRFQCPTRHLGVSPILCPRRDKL